MIDDSKPITYLRHGLGPSPAEIALSGDLGLAADGFAPVWMFLRSCERIHEVSAWAAPRARAERRVKQAVAALAVALAGNLAYMVTTMQARASEAGAARARADDQAAEINQLRLDVRGIWQRVTGVDQDPPGPHSDLMPVPSAFALSGERSSLTCRVGQPDQLPGS